MAHHDVRDSARRTLAATSIELRFVATTRSSRAGSHPTMETTRTASTQRRSSAEVRERLAVDVFVIVIASNDRMYLHRTRRSMFLSA
jgi:hypothetical protein